MRNSQNASLKISIPAAKVKNATVSLTLYTTFSVSVRKEQQYSAFSSAAASMKSVAMPKM
jgi:hypothetical protein